MDCIEFLRPTLLEKTKHHKTYTMNVYDHGPVDYKLLKGKDWPGRYSIIIDGRTVGWVIRQESGDDKNCWKGYTSRGYVTFKDEEYFTGNLVTIARNREEAIDEILFGARFAIARRTA